MQSRYRLHVRRFHSWVISFRVASLDALVARLRASAILVEQDTEAYPNGRIARLRDPGGNPIELWEPVVSDH